MKKTCNSKIKHTCDGTKPAMCIVYETDLPDFSEIEECPSIEETTEELYSLVGEIREQLDLSELGEECLDYLLDENDKIIVKNVLLKYEEEICLLKSKVETLETRPLCEMLLGDCVDTSCLELPCEQAILTYADWMTAITAKVCD